MPRSLVAGAAGFIGSHLVDRLLAEGHEVIGVDNLITGRKANLEAAAKNDKFRFHQMPVDSGAIVWRDWGKLDHVWHLASPASPKAYQEHPVETLMANGAGTYMLLELAKRHGATFLLASTSEVYGDPEVSPQPETYWGRVNPIGPRSCYDEGKRFAEALTMAYHNAHGVDTRIARIFNTYGPRMRLDDGRVIPTFIRQALAGEPLTVHGGGKQTRSFLYVDDLVDGLVRLMLNSARHLPVNLGSWFETPIRDLAMMIGGMVGGASIVSQPADVDDPQRRSAANAVAFNDLGWTIKVKLEDGLMRTLDALRADSEAQKPTAVSPQ